MEDKIQIGVIGSWRNNLPERSYEIAEEVGAELAKAGCYVITGAGTGVMEYAMRGTKAAGGTTIGLVPAEEWRKYDFLGKYVDIKISTGTFEEGRIPILVHSCDGLIAIGGSSGTMTEVLNAYNQGRPVVVLKDSGDMSNRLHLVLDEEGYFDSKKLVKVRFADTAEEAVKVLLKAIADGEGVPGSSMDTSHAKFSD